MTQATASENREPRQGRKLRIRPEGHSDEYLKLRDFLAAKVAEVVQEAVSQLIPELAAMAERLEAQEQLVKQIQTALMTSGVQRLLQPSSGSAASTGNRIYISDGTGVQHEVPSTPEALWIAPLREFGSGVADAISDYEYRVQNVGTPTNIITSATFTRPDGANYFASLIDEMLTSDDDMNSLINDLSRDTDGELGTQT